MRAIINLTGQTFGRLTVISVAGRTHHKNVTWNCLCVCGNTVIVSSGNLRREVTKSCGCIRKETCARTGVQGTVTRIRHGHAKRSQLTRIYATWQGMKQRCSNPNTFGYPWYGARGITVCERWKESFENFYNDMGPKPSPEHSLERINNDGNYEPNNVRWATPIEQANNRRTFLKAA